MKRIQTRLASVPCAVLLLALAGCATRTPYLDSQFGQSVRLLNAQQTINPHSIPTPLMAWMARRRQAGMPITKSHTTNPRHKRAASP
jgi:predicted component of type VI protein secretion system